jgi:hypothetical protein
MDVPFTDRGMEWRALSKPRNARRKCPWGATRTMAWRLARREARTGPNPALRRLIRACHYLRVAPCLGTRAGLYKRVLV